MIKIVAELPRTPSMKVSRPALRDLLAAADIGREQAATVRSGEKKGSA